MQPIERCRQSLILSRVGEQIARELLGHELVVWHIVVERLDDPITPRPNLHRHIALIAIRVGIASHIQPHVGHPLAIGGRGQQAIDDPLVGFAGIIGEKRIEFVERGWEPGEVEGGSAQPGGSVGFFGWTHPSTFVSRRDETIDRVSRPTFARRGDVDRLGHRLERPMPLILGSTANPLHQQLTLFDRK